MKKLSLIASSSIAILALAGCQTTAPKPESNTLTAKTSKKLVMKVSTATLDETHKTWKLSASGFTPTSGWTGGQLISAGKPVDGAYTFDFVAKAPTKIVSQMVTPISASLTWSHPPKDVKSVHVVAAQNHVDATINAKK